MEDTKNGDNRQKITITRNRVNPTLCPVLAAYCIYCRAQRLNKYANRCLVIFKDKKKKTSCIANIMISKHLQQVAQKAHAIADPKSLKLWMPHSLHVGACVLLHAAGKVGSFTQLRLRWRSLVFMDYLCNTITLAKQHILALNMEV